MAQQRKLSLQEMERYLDLLEQENYHSKRSDMGDLLRTLVVIDKFLVKHDQTPLARQLRSATRKAMTVD
jgi:phage gp16-like protein